MSGQIQFNFNVYENAGLEFMPDKLVDKLYAELRKGRPVAKEKFARAIRTWAGLCAYVRPDLEYDSIHPDAVSATDQRNQLLALARAARALQVCAEAMSISAVCRWEVTGQSKILSWDVPEKANAIASQADRAAKYLDEQLVRTGPSSFDHDTRLHFIGELLCLWRQAGGPPRFGDGFISFARQALSPIVTLPGDDQFERDVSRARADFRKRKNLFYLSWLDVYLRGK